MPELPEVETIKNQLRKKLPLRIKNISYSKVCSSILKPKSKNFNPKNLLITKISRHGKMLIFHLENDLFILSHLGMSGSWRIDESRVKEKHTHIQLICESEDKTPMHFAYIDPRRFGNMYYFDKAQKDEYIKKLGVDISSKKFNEQYLEDIFAKFPEKELKPFLLDQKYFAGCGNYIASEICALSRILPTRKCMNIKKSELKKIIKSTNMIIKSQLKNNGLTFSGGYQDAYGDKGGGVKNLVVFHQDICGLCKTTTVKKITMATRGTFYCPKCQS